MSSRRRVGVIAACSLIGIVSTSVRPDAVRATADSVTFSKDVAPILNAHCVSCHHAGEIAPMSLTSYVESRPWARAIRKAVTAREMPPWGADPAFGEFANDMRLSDQEIGTLTAWVDGGALEGDPKDLPPAVVFNDGWKNGTPDLIVTMKEDFAVPARGPMLTADVPMEATFSEDKHVEHIEVLPGNRRVTHHAVVNMIDADGTHRIGAFQPGGAGNLYPKGLVRKVPKGAQFVLNMQYNPSGRVEGDRTSVGLTFAKGAIQNVLLTAESAGGPLDIAPGLPNYEATGRPYTFEEDSHIRGLLPRMNARGKDFTFTLVYPDRREQVLLHVAKFNPDWQPTYVLKEPIAAPKGSRIETKAHYDNSANNKRNPDPTARVQGDTEILAGYFDYTVDRQALQEAR